MADNFADIIGDILGDILRTGPKDVQVHAKNVSIRPPLPSPPPKKKNQEDGVDDSTGVIRREELLSQHLKNNQ